MMKLTPIAIAALALGLQAGTTIAQERNRERPEQPRQQQRAAQENPRGERGPRPAMPLVRALDTNGDRVIDAREISRANESLLTLDTDDDGELSREEFRGERPGPRGPRAEGREGREEREGGEKRRGREARPERERNEEERREPDRARAGSEPRSGIVPPLLAALDTTRDGSLSADEITDAPASLRKLDANGDGRLTPDELRPQRPKGAARDRAPTGERPEPRDRPNQQ